jgi:hypothetical protein
MKSLLPLTVCMLLAGNLFAAASAEDNNTETGKSSPQATQKDDRGKTKSSPPATTFTPSEKVGADSAVSFPVDI